MNISAAVFVFVMSSHFQHSLLLIFRLQMIIVFHISLVGRVVCNTARNYENNAKIAASLIIVIMTRAKRVL